MTLNNALSQNWVVFTVHTPKTQTVSALRPGHMHSAVSPACVVARWAPCLARWAVSQLRVTSCYVVSRHKRPPSFAKQKLYRYTELIPHSLRTHALPIAIQSCCIMTRVGKWAVAHPTSSPAHFFFSFIFFSFVVLIVKPHFFFQIFQ